MISVDLDGSFAAFVMERLTGVPVGRVQFEFVVYGGFLPVCAVKLSRMSSRTDED